ncbi:MAG: hypothetical protein KDB07_13165, partial [Planctomycetes bacterium]|nr:hypothetical protein [Planctomycetota bacterium]
MKRRRQNAFLSDKGEMPQALRIAQLLNLPIARGLCQLKLEGPSLMWGTARYSIPKERKQGLARRILGSIAGFVAKHAWTYILVYLAMLLFFAAPLFAQGVPNLLPETAESPEDVTSTIELMLLLTVLTLAPSIL